MPLPGDDHYSRKEGNSRKTNGVLESSQLASKRGTDRSKQSTESGSRKPKSGDHTYNFVKDKKGMNFHVSVPLI